MSTYKKLLTITIIFLLLPACTLPRTQSCQEPIFNADRYLPTSFKISTIGKGKDAKLTVSYTDQNNKTQKRTVYTTTWLGNNSPNNPNCDDWSPIISSHHGNINFSDSFLLQYQTLSEKEKRNYGTVYRGTLNTEKRSFYGGKYHATYANHQLFYFSNTEQKPNPAYWQPIKLSIKKLKEKEKSASCC